MGGCSGGAGAESTESRRTGVVKNHSCWRPGQLRPLQGFLKSPCMHSTSAISRCLLCRPRTDDPMSVPSSVLPPGPLPKETRPPSAVSHSYHMVSLLKKGMQSPRFQGHCFSAMTCSGHIRAQVGSHNSPKHNNWTGLC